MYTHDEAYTSHSAFHQHYDFVAPGDRKHLPHSLVFYLGLAIQLESSAHKETQTTILSVDFLDEEENQIGSLQLRLASR